jgi:Uma2 family endonuclease
MSASELTTGRKREYTYADYAALPEGSSYQLIAGQLTMTPAPTPYHQQVAIRLEYLLVDFLLIKQKVAEVLHAPIDVYFDEHEVYQPDIIAILRDRLEIIGEAKIEGAPDLVVEILSPSTAYYDLRHKRDVYANSGVKEYWIVDPLEKNIEVYQNRNGNFELFRKAASGGEVTSRLFKDLTIRSAEIF